MDRKGNQEYSRVVALDLTDDQHELLFSACERGPEAITKENEMEGQPEVVPIMVPETSSRDLLLPGEDLRKARERPIAHLVEKFPAFNDPYVLSSFRGEPTAMLVGLPPEERDAAPLIGRIYQLLDLEMREHRERFAPPERQ